MLCLRIVFFFPAVNATSMNFSSIETLTGTNYKKWKQDVEIFLGLMDIDSAIRVEAPAALTEVSTDEEKKAFNKWHRDNRMSLLVMKRAMTETVRGGIPISENAKEFLDSVGEKFKESEKAETGNLMTALTSMQYDGVGSIREHIMKLIDLASKLKNLEITISDEFLVHLALNSLPSQYSQLKVTYNAQKDKWNLNELISICVQEEERLRKEKGKSVHLVAQDPPCCYHFISVPG